MYRCIYDYISLFLSFIIVDSQFFPFNLIGNSFNDEERCVAAGYDNGDLKIFDLRTMSLRWETHLENGVCSRLLFLSFPFHSFLSFPFLFFSFLFFPFLFFSFLSLLRWETHLEKSVCNKLLLVLVYEGSKNIRSTIVIGIAGLKK